MDRRKGVLCCWLLGLPTSCPAAEEERSRRTMEPPEFPDPTSVVRGLMPFAATLGLTVTKYEPGEVRTTLAWKPELCTAGGALHGGVLMALADTSGGACAFLNLPSEAQGTTTVESKTNFLRGIRGGEVEAISRPLHVGRTVIVIETDLRDGEGKLAARVTQSQLVLGAR
jgi:1,4-dihydroxy-2-naphthoyl-CoA hydrolase